MKTTCVFGEIGANGELVVLVPMVNLGTFVYTCLFTEAETGLLQFHSWSVLCPEPASHADSGRSALRAGGAGGAGGEEGPVRRGNEARQDTAQHCKGTGIRENGRPLQQGG